MSWNQDGNQMAEIIVDDDEVNAYVEKIDEASATVTYLGKAMPGTATSAALWKIQRIGISGTVTTIENADGNMLFDNVWDNRASLSYS